MGERRRAGKVEQTDRDVLPYLGHLSPRQITADDCNACIAARCDTGRKDATIRTELGYLRAVLAWAHQARLIERPPHIALPPVPRRRDRHPTRDEVRKLLDAAGDTHIRLAMLLMPATAGRIGALLDLTWDRVEMDRRIIRPAPHDTGPKKGRVTVPVNDPLAEALTIARRATLSRLVIEWGGGKVGSIKTGLNATVRRAGLDHYTPRDLRRTAGRFMAEAEDIAQYLGHSNPNIARPTYGQFSPAYLRKAASALEF